MKAAYSSSGGHRQPGRRVDRLIDTISARAEQLVQHGLRSARRTQPHEPLHHGLAVIDFLATRLALAEYCLRRRLPYSFYRSLAARLT